MSVTTENGSAAFARNAGAAPSTPPDTSRLTTVSLDDKYTATSGAIFLSGIQALVRLPMMQRLRDQAAGLNTAGFISGYRGSPLGGLDENLWKAKKQLEAHHVQFVPGVNEDLAATAVWGSQQVDLIGPAKYDGVFSMWYGKGPGVDRCGDVFKHANNAGSAKHGGVLVLAGDDHAAKSSSTAHQSDHILNACGIPVLYPSSVQEYIDYGLHAWAMSRYTGLWVSMKCVTDIIESGAAVDFDPDRVQITLPTDFEMPAGGLNIRWPDTVLEQEVRMNSYKWYAALAYARANKLNKIIWDSPKARIGIITAGKSYLDTRQALADLGIDEQAAADIGETSIVSRTGGATTFAMGMANFLKSYLGGHDSMAFWYHFAIMFEALFILTTVDNGTRVARYQIGEMLGNVRKLKKFADPTWKPGNIITTLIATALWGGLLWMGVSDANGGINAMVPIFGISNQLLAAACFVLITVCVAKMGYWKHLWIPVVPLVWDIAVTFTADFQKIFGPLSYFTTASKYQAQIDSGELTGEALTNAKAALSNAYLDGVLSVFFLVMMGVFVVVGIVVVARTFAAGKYGAETTSEEPFVESEWFAPSSLIATKLEKKVQREYSAKLHELVRNGQVAA